MTLSSLLVLLLIVSVAIAQCKRTRYNLVSLNDPATLRKHVSHLPKNIGHVLPTRFVKLLISLFFKHPNKHVQPKKTDYRQHVDDTEVEALQEGTQCVGKACGNSDKSKEIKLCAQCA